MFIDQWWGKFIGGTDDSLLLIDYLASKNKSEFHLKDIMDEIHLTEILMNGDWEEGDLSWQVSENFEPEFDLVADVVMDLAAITLESLINKEVNFKLLNKTSKNSGSINIQTDNDSLNLLINALDQFIDSNPHYSGLAELMDEKDLSALISECKELSIELKNFL